MSIATSMVAPPRTALPLRLMGTLLLILPSGLLLLAGLSSADSAPWRYAVAAGVIFTLALILLRAYGSWKSLLQRNALSIPLLALGWFWICMPDPQGPVAHLLVGVLLLIPILVLMVQELSRASMGKLRRARVLICRLAERTDWPANLADCRKLPEVRALKESIEEDPTPALVLLMHPKPQVRLVALTAMEYRRTWKRGHAQLVLQAGQYATEPLIQAAALLALANMNDGSLMNGVCHFLRDPSKEVRRAAAEVLLGNATDQWNLIRPALRGHLTDPRFARDGALPCYGTLPLHVLTDLTNWACESGSVGHRAAMTLIRYYQRSIQIDPNPDLIQYLKNQMLEEKVASSIRVEIAQMLRQGGYLSNDMYEAMLATHQPGPVRLAAAEALLKVGRHPRAEDVLREVARQPNREIAILAAVIIQNCLRIDMGLPIGQAPPDPHSKQAAEVTRRVIQWATNGPVVTPTRMVSMPELPMAEPDPGTHSPEQPKTNTPWIW